MEILLNVGEVKVKRLVPQWEQRMGEWQLNNELPLRLRQQRRADADADLSFTENHSRGSKLKWRSQVEFIFGHKLNLNTEV